MESRAWYTVVELEITNSSYFTTCADDVGDILSSNGGKVFGSVVDLAIEIMLSFTSSTSSCIFLTLNIHKDIKEL